MLELQRVTTMSPIFIILLIVGVASANSPTRRPEPIRDCGPYAAWSTCASGCPTTCDNYKEVDIVCAAVCRNGCVCIDGRIKKSKNSMECVLPKECGKY